MENCGCALLAVGGVFCVTFPAKEEARGPGWVGVDEDGGGCIRWAWC